MFEAGKAERCAGHVGFANGARGRFCKKVSCFRAGFSGWVSRSTHRSKGPGGSVRVKFQRLRGSRSGKKRKIETDEINVVDLEARWRGGQSQALGSRHRACDIRTGP